MPKVRHSGGSCTMMCEPLVPVMRRAAAGAASRFTPSIQMPAAFTMALASTRADAAGSVASASSIDQASPLRLSPFTGVWLRTMAPMRSASSTLSTTMRSGHSKRYSRNDATAFSRSKSRSQPTSGSFLASEGERLRWSSGTSLGPSAHSMRKPRLTCHGAYLSVS